jgi:hypothetical protein
MLKTFQKMKILAMAVGCVQNLLSLDRMVRRSSKRKKGRKGIF